LFSHHLQALGEVESDYIATAINFLGMPYLWGGRTARGLDCSALVQLSLARAGLPVPRDSDQQEKSLGQLVGDGTDLRDIEEGDVIFFPGHVGFVLEGFRFLHANAFDMRVSVHRLSDVLDRAKESGQWFTSIRRISQS